MNTLTIKGWQKRAETGDVLPIEQIHFRVSETDHIRLEQAEEMLLSSGRPELFIPVNKDTMELSMSGDCGDIGECQFRVYLSPQTNRGHFHLVASELENNALVYSNAVMIDQLG